VTDPAHVAALARAALAGEYDACGVLADYLEERGDPRGVLLRRRWKRWQKDFEKAVKWDKVLERVAPNPTQALADFLRADGVAEDAIFDFVTHRGSVNYVLRRYVRERFPEARHRS